MKNILRFVLAASLAVAAGLSIRSAAQAATEQWYSFTTSCSNNDQVNVAIGAAQIYVRVTDGPGANQATFHFINVGPEASSITDIYFDDGTLLGIASITDNPPLVDFGIGATPAEMPGANNCNFETTAGFSADSESPTQPKGVNPLEFVDIVFNLQGSQTYDDVIAELNSGALRIGIHVQGFEIGSSETFINDPFTAVSLSSFGSTAAGRQVTLDWRTGSESNTAGFNLYRATSADGQRIKVNEQLIAAQSNGASGASYSVVDRPGYGVFYYWLEDVSYTGQSTLHSPILVHLKAMVQRPQYRPTLPGSHR